MLAKVPDKIGRIGIFFLLLNRFENTLVDFLVKYCKLRYVNDFFESGAIKILKGQGLIFSWSGGKTHLESIVPGLKALHPSQTHVYILFMFPSCTVGIPAKLRISIQRRYTN